jgi:transcriptional regulator with PAS, ATPase and Fis domain
LRSRREDIIPLALHLMADLNLDLKRSFKGFAPEAAELLQAYAWPGNVRELRNVLERVMSLHQRELITKNLLPLELREMPHMSEHDTAILDLRGNHYPSLKDMERRYIEQVLESVEGNRTRAAKILEIHPASLFRKLKSWKPK